MTAKQILEMIEAVRPDDTARLDEIDARVWCYLNEKEFAGKNGDLFCYQDGHSLQSFGFAIRYTRSRDALKAIRPDGWHFAISKVDCYQNWMCEMYDIRNDSDGFSINSGFCGTSLPTEELAELHAIIQAIAYERGEK